MPAITDAEIDSLIVQCGRQMRREAVRSLLAGNDTQCFSTEQYVDAYVRRHKTGDLTFIRDLLAWPSIPSDPASEPLATWHLRQMPGLIREVRPGVWAAVEEAKR